MSEIGMNIYSLKELIQQFAKDMGMEEEYAKAFDRDHDENVAGKLSHVYNVDLIQTSGHDWVASETRQRNGSIRKEFVDPIVDLTDRAEVEVIPMLKDETECSWCHLIMHISSSVCPNCDKKVTA
jgi:hypothetical protein